MKSAGIVIIVMFVVFLFLLLIFVKKKLSRWTSGKSKTSRDTESIDAKELYDFALDGFELGEFRDAAAILEETVKLSPDSAPVLFTLGATYSKIAGEYGSDEEKVRPWAKKSRDSFKKALDLTALSGELNEEQLALARNSVTAFNRIIEMDSPTLTEEKRKKIFAAFMETHDTEFLLSQEIADISETDPADLGAMMQLIDEGSTQAEEGTYTKIGMKFKLSEGRLREIVEEGKKKKWPFRGVAR